MNPEFKNLSDFDYELPESFIAQTPLKKRDESKFMVYDEATDTTEIRRFYNVLDYLRAGDVVVVNNTRVIPARLEGHKISQSGEADGAKIEVFLLKKIELDVYEVLCKPLKKFKIGDKVLVANKLVCEMLFKDAESGTARVRLSAARSGAEFKSAEELIDEVGVLPLPHYIRETLSKRDSERYQTVYNKIKGSVAAPTAGLHWTSELIEKAKQKGVIFCEVLLNVGLGTFRPVSEEIITNHKMHSEYFEIPEAAAAEINRARRENRRIVCVGTTSLRTLEGAFAKFGEVRACSGETDIFIYPPYNFKVADALITNFHLPKSTLIMLVSAFINRDKILELYELAKRESFRFFSFGDAMMLIKK
ncbi:MAG: tRNA preQ1(34) S-adenosylmethionine ribosyltransferase-isomerase QueA [Christensenellaceae bacterium]|jgi:S-adenosylmethionine:tRNA ribosyltransferase-isomerase|nr:tRNA preQ1(34) S-adenosylmethionine ribosyltransferase-isomerase QueA [Christensenellaceae bacterium]